MDITLTGEQETLRRTVRDFAVRELGPTARISQILSPLAGES